MPHYNWYDLTAYEKASILAAQTFPTYQGVGSPIDNDQPGDPGESYVDTDTDALYFNIGGGQWVAAGGSGGSNPAPIIAGTECINAQFSRSMTEDEHYAPVAADWTVSGQTGSALSIDSGGNFVTSDEGTFSVFIAVTFFWSVPFVIDASFAKPAVITAANKPGSGGFTLACAANIIPTDGFGMQTVESLQGPPVHYVPAPGDASSGTIISSGSWTVNSAYPFPADQTFTIQINVFITNQ